MRTFILWNSAPLCNCFLGVDVVWVQDHSLQVQRNQVSLQVSCEICRGRTRELLQHLVMLKTHDSKPLGVKSLRNGKQEQSHEPEL